MRIYHIATLEDWTTAKRQGSYDTSTLGRTLAEEGFIHASWREQVRTTYDTFYAGKHLDLVLLTIDTAKLTAEGVTWREDHVGEQTFPHIYGPLPVSAVVDAQRLDDHGGTGSFTALFFGEVVKRAGLVLLVMITVFVGVQIGEAAGDPAPLILGLAGLGLGLLLAVRLSRRLS